MKLKKHKETDQVAEFLKWYVRERKTLLEKNGRRHHKKQRIVNRKKFVYFVQIGSDGPVKIGLSWNPEKRKDFFYGAEYRKNIPGHERFPFSKKGRRRKKDDKDGVTLNLVAKFEGDLYSEKACHEMFGDYRLKGEWFSPEVLYFLEIFNP